MRASNRKRALRALRARSRPEGRHRTTPPGAGGLAAPGGARFCVGLCCDALAILWPPREIREITRELSREIMYSRELSHEIM